MIDRSGKVLGVVFGAAVDDADTGFVLTGERGLASARQGRQHVARPHRRLYRLEVATET